MSRYLKACIMEPEVTTILIATGYWDIPGTARLLRSWRLSLVVKGPIKLLIGKDPILYPYSYKILSTKVANILMITYVQTSMN